MVAHYPYNIPNDFIDEFLRSQRQDIMTIGVSGYSSFSSTSMMTMDAGRGTTAEQERQNYNMVVSEALPTKYFVVKSAIMSETKDLYSVEDIEYIVDNLNEYDLEIFKDASKINEQLAVGRWVKVPMLKRDNLMLRHPFISTCINGIIISIIISILLLIIF